MSNRERLCVWLYACSASPHTADLISQMQELLEVAAERGHTVRGTSQDKITNWNGPRTGLVEMRRAIRMGSANAVLVKDLSHLSSDYKTALCILQFLQDHGAVLLCAESNVHYELYICGLEQPLRRRAIKNGCGLPWL